MMGLLKFADHVVVSCSRLSANFPGGRRPYIREPKPHLDQIHRLTEPPAGVAVVQVITTVPC